MEGGTRTRGVRWEWPPRDSQQENGDLGPTAATQMGEATDLPCKDRVPADASVLAR